MPTRLSLRLAELLITATLAIAVLVYVGQTVQVYDTTLTTNRGTCNVTACDPINAQTITVDVVPGGTVATDVLASPGVPTAATAPNSPPNSPPPSKPSSKPTRASTNATPN